MMYRNPVDRTAPGRRLKPSWHNQRNLAGFLMAMPAMVLFALFAIYPMGRVFYLSFFDYSLITSSEYVGLGNFRSLISDRFFHESIKNTLVYMVGTYAPALLLALGIALVLNRSGRAAGILRTIYFVPVAMAWVIVAVIWRIIYHPQGLFNQLTGLHINWLTDSTYAKLALILMSIWKELGFYLIIFLAGLQSIDGDLLEAAAIDGATAWQRLRDITLPLLKPVTAVASVIAVIRGMQAFTPQYVMTGGGPGSATEVVNLFVYKTAFVYGNMGRASAVAVMLFLALVGVTLIQLRVFRSGE